jgi:hypothetical protein
MNDRQKRLSNDYRTIFFVFFVPFVVTDIKMLVDWLFFEMRDLITALQKMIVEALKLQLGID